MVIWIECAQQYSTDFNMAHDEIYSYYKTYQNIIITEDDFIGICGPTSVIKYEIEKLESRLIQDGKVPKTSVSPLSAELLSSTQWAQQNLLGDYIN